MANWSDLMTYVRSNYEINDESSDYCRLLFNVGDGRTQWVLLFHRRLRGGEEDWVDIQSPVGKAADLPLLAVLQEVGSLVVGAVAVVGDWLVLKHTVPVANLDLDEFERPLHLLLHSADALEKKYVGADHF